MKDATGGTLLMGLAAAILIIFIIFVAFFINYGKTFKIKNQIINYLEQSEGQTGVEIRNFIDNDTEYNKDDYDICYRIIKKGVNTAGFTYEVTLKLTFDRTILSDSFNIEIPISGETKTITSGEIYDKLVTDGNIEGLNECG